MNSKIGRNKTGQFRVLIKENEKTGTVLGYDSADALFLVSIDGFEGSGHDGGGFERTIVFKGPIRPTNKSSLWFDWSDLELIDG